MVRTTRSVNAVTRAAPAPAAARPANGRPEPLPPKIVAAWKEAGAEVGWMRESALDMPEKAGPEFVPEKEGTSGDVPAFRFPELRKGVLATLPAPPAAFGLDLRGGQTTDA
jgi:hypothetical protein